MLSVGGVKRKHKWSVICVSVAIMLLNAAKVKVHCGMSFVQCRFKSHFYILHTKTDVD